jgi:hypothetical protein
VISNICLKRKIEKLQKHNYVFPSYCWQNTKTRRKKLLSGKNNKNIETLLKNPIGFKFGRKKKTNK